jgi:hypothetical protein
MGYKYCSVWFNPADPEMHSSLHMVLSAAESDCKKKGRKLRSASVVVRLTAWYDWLLVVLVLAFGAYTCKCLDYCLTMGVQNAMLARAKEVGGIFAATGRIPVRQGSSGSRSNQLFISVYPSKDSGRNFSDQAQGKMADPGAVGREAQPLAVPADVRPRLHSARLLIATVPSTFGNKKYLVEVGTPKRPIRALFRDTAITMLMALLGGLVLASFGSFIFVKCALIPVQKIVLAVRALPVVNPAEHLESGVVLAEIANLCATVNGMVCQLEDSFEIGTGLPAEALRALKPQLEKVRGELTTVFENEPLSSMVPRTLLCLLDETERSSKLSRDLAAYSCEDNQSSTCRLKFYLDRLAASGAEHICVLTKKLATDLTCKPRDPSRDEYSPQW